MSLDEFSELLATSPLDREAKLLAIELASRSDDAFVNDLIVLLRECMAAEGEAMAGLREHLVVLKAQQAAGLAVARSGVPIKRQEDEVARAKKIEEIRRRILESK